MKYVIGNQTHAAKTEEVSAILDKAQFIAWSSHINEGNTVFDIERDFQAWARSAPSPIAEATKETRS